MQIAALRMRVANGDARTDHDVCTARKRRGRVEDVAGRTEETRDQLAPLAMILTPVSAPLKTHLQTCLACRVRGACAGTRNS